MEKMLIYLKIYVFISIAFIFIYLFYISKKIGSKNEVTKIFKDLKIKIKENTFINSENYDNKGNSSIRIITKNKIDYFPKISVIIIFYNNEDLIIKCLDNIMNQTLKEIEIICIDDGSTDNSLYILNNYTQDDKRITILKQNKNNSTKSKNIGLVIAKGKYLIFLSSNYYYQKNMLEIMYQTIIKMRSDIAICNCKYIENKNINLGSSNFYNELRVDLIPKNNNFSLMDMKNNIFQISDGWLFDKLFKRSFILSNNLTFKDIIYYNEHQFTFLALCCAKSITTTKKRLIIKPYIDKSSFHLEINKNISFFLLSINKIKSEFERFEFYNLVKNSFLKWIIKIYFIQFNYLDYNSKIVLLNKLYTKFNFLKNNQTIQKPLNIYNTIENIKYENLFPTINIAYIIDNSNLNLFMISLFSILNNSEHENINFFLLCDNKTSVDFHKLNNFKQFHFFNYKSFSFTDSQKKMYPNLFDKNRDYFKIILADKFHYLKDIDKLLYIKCNTFIKQSLLSLWENKLNDNLVAGFKDIYFNKAKTEKLKLKDKLYINDYILLFNLKQWRKFNIFNNFIKYIDKNKFETNQDILNAFTDNKKVILSSEYNFMKIINNNLNLEYNNKSLSLYDKNGTNIINLSKIKSKSINPNITLYKDFSQYKTIINNSNKIELDIPIVLSSDNKYAPFMYTTMLSILENKNKDTFYVFYLLVPENFSNNNKRLILQLKHEYQCNINFIYIKKFFENLEMKISHITFPTYYRLLIGDLLPDYLEKCIYLDVDICVLKDLTSLYNINITNNYIAGVISPSYYFKNNTIHCKRLNLPSMNQYINAGMLLVNLKEIRKDNMTKKFIDLSKKNYKSQDQDVLNVACYGKILTLAPKYNAMVTRLKEYDNKLKTLYTEEEIIEANNFPYIIHYSDRNKPWNSLYVYMEKYWWNASKKTPFFNNSFIREHIFKNRLQEFWYNKTSKTLNLHKPKTLNEKIQWLNLYDSTPIKTRLSDKYSVRKWVTEKIGEEYLIPLLGIYDKFEDINFTCLPAQFVIKCNHGKGYNIIVNNKTQLNLTKIKSKLQKWMNEDYAFKEGLELQYRDIKHKIMIEAFINNFTSDLKKYEFFCFNGKPLFYIYSNEKNVSLYKIFYDLNDKHLIFNLNDKDVIFSSFKNKDVLKKLLGLISTLSSDFNYIRIVFYIKIKYLKFNLFFSIINSIILYVTINPIITRVKIGIGINEKNFFDSEKSN